MNDHLVKEWQRWVRPGDTIICLGDVGHPNAWRDRRLVLDIRNCPRNRFLVPGNHDRDRDALREAGSIYDAVHAGAVRDRPAPGAEPRTAVGGPARHDQRARPHSRRPRADARAHQHHHRAPLPFRARFSSRRSPFRPLRRPMPRPVLKPASPVAAVTPACVGSSPHAPGALAAATIHTALRPSHGAITTPARVAADRELQRRGGRCAKK